MYVIKYKWFVLLFLLLLCENCKHAVPKNRCYLVYHSSTFGTIPWKSFDIQKLFTINVCIDSVMVMTSQHFNDIYHKTCLDNNYYSSATDTSITRLNYTSGADTVAPCVLRPWQTCFDCAGQVAHWIMEGFQQSMLFHFGEMTKKTMLFYNYSKHFRT